MQEISFTPYDFNIECTLKIGNSAIIPMYEDLTNELLYIMHPLGNRERINKWMEKAKIEIIDYKKFEHNYSPLDEIVIDAFWYIVNQVTKTEDPLKMRYFKNILYHVLKNRESNLEEIKSFVDIILNYSILHFEVLRLIDGILDFFYFMKTPPINILPETLAKCIEYATPELRKEYEKIEQIWKDLLKLKLRKEASLHMWMTANKFAWMSLTSELGKKFLKIAVIQSSL